MKLDMWGLQKCNSFVAKFVNNKAISKRNFGNKCEVYYAKWTTERSILVKRYFSKKVKCSIFYVLSD